MKPFGQTSADQHVHAICMVPLIQVLQRFREAAKEKKQVDVVECIRLVTDGLIF